MQNNLAKILNKLKEHSTCVYVNDIYRLIINQSDKSTVKNTENKFQLFVTFASRIFVSGIILLFNIFLKEPVDYNIEIAFARVERSETKIKRFKKNIQIISDDIKHRDFSIYRVGSRKKRVVFIFLNYLQTCISDYRNIYRITLEDEIAPFRKRILNEMVRRIPHTVVYRYSIDNILENYNLESVITGQMYDRYALIEDALSKKHNKILVCFPHGVESTLEMPVGYIGQKFYCTSNYLCSELKKLYKSDKYIYSTEVIEKLFRVNTISRNHNRNVVFFTQPTNQEKVVEVIKLITQHLKPKGIRILLKLHPLDHKKYYKNCEAKIVSDFEYSIHNNICISVASTVLLESLYNYSIAISIIKLINDGEVLKGNTDFLNDERIYKPKNENELIEILNTNINFQVRNEEETVCQKS